MKTDSLFYELFQFDTQSLLRLVHLKVEGQYTFESITIKTTEKRLDGFFKNVEGKGPNIFLEVQGYSDPKIYWRLFRKICTHYEQKEDTNSAVAIVLFLDQKHDPGTPPLFSSLPPHQLIRVNLIDCLKTVEDKPGALTVLKALVVPSKKELVGTVPKWKADIQSLKLPEDKTKILIELLEYAIIQRFPELTLKEVQTMLELTPLEQTVAGQELIQIGVKQGRQQGIDQGRHDELVRMVREAIIEKWDREMDSLISLVDQAPIDILEHVLLRIVRGDQDGVKVLLNKEDS